MVVYDFNESDEFVTEVKPITTVENHYWMLNKVPEENGVRGNP